MPVYGHSDVCRRIWMQFQSTPSIRRATDRLHRAGLELLISIHALHTEGDVFVTQSPALWSKISIHALHTEGDSKNSETSLLFLTYLTENGS